MGECERRLAIMKNSTHASLLLTGKVAPITKERVSLSQVTCIRTNAIQFTKAQVSAQTHRVLGGRSISLVSMVMDFEKHG